MRIRYWSSDVCSSDLAGPATIESYTVFYGRDATPKAGVVVARTPEGKRTLAHVDVGDPTMLAFLTDGKVERSEEHTSELQSLMRISYAVFCLKIKTHVQLDMHRNASDMMCYSKARHDSYRSL